MTKGTHKLTSMDSNKIQNMIYTIRGEQVMIDSDFANIYGVETRVLNQAVARNIARFPDKFRFQLTKEEINLISQNVISSEERLRSQNVTLKKGPGQHRKYLPYVFTEQGIAMLSAVLRSETAVKVSVQIMNAFVEMRHLIGRNNILLDQVARLRIEVRQNKKESDQSFEYIFKAIEEKEISQKQGIYFDGQTFDAYTFVADIIRSAKKSIILIDNYIDDRVLTLFSKRKKGIPVRILTQKIKKQHLLDIEKFNEQYPPATVEKFDLSHDRFLIIDEKNVYHIGASLKDLGRKWFAFSKMEMNVIQFLGKLK